MPGLNCKWAISENEPISTKSTEYPRVPLTFIRRSLLFCSILSSVVAGGDIKWKAKNYLSVARQ